MVINLTSHEVVIYSSTDCVLRDGKLFLREEEEEAGLQPLRAYPAAEVPARVVVDYENDGVADGICIFRLEVKDILGLPEPKKDTWYIVSKIVAQACPERSDLLIPDGIVRDKSGAVVGCVNFSRV